MKKGIPEGPCFRAKAGIDADQLLHSIVLGHYSFWKLSVKVLLI